MLVKRNSFGLGVVRRVQRVDRSCTQLHAQPPTCIDNHAGTPISASYQSSLMKPVFRAALVSQSQRDSATQGGARGWKGRIWVV